MATYRSANQAKQAIIAFGLKDDDFEIKRNQGRVSRIRGDGRQPSWELYFSGNYVGRTSTLDELVSLAAITNEKRESETVIDDTETFEAEQELAECDDVIAQQEIDFSYDVDFSIDGYREDAEHILSKNFPEAKFYHHDWNGNNFSAWLLMIDKSGLRIRINYGCGGYCLSMAVDALETFISENKKQPTVPYTAKPSDSRCSWWCVQVPEDQELDGTRLSAPYLKRGADLELKAGDMLIDSEANHHRKNRGYTTVLGVCDGEQMQFIKPTAEIKRYIKLHGGQDLMHETGDINAVIRMAVWLRRQSDLKLAIHQLLTA